MNATLPIPNPGDWCTLTDAEQVLGLSRSQVWRLAKRKTLKVYYIGDARQGRLPLIWRGDLEELARARRVAGVNRREHPDA